MSRLPALSSVSAGLVVIAIDFRTEALDLVPDPVGWLLVAYGMRVVGANVAAILAAVAAVLSLSDVYLGFKYVSLNPLTLEVVRDCPLDLVCPAELRYFDVGVVRALMIAAVPLFGGAAIVLFVRELIRRAAGVGYESLRRRLRLVQAVLAAVWVAVFVGVVAADTSGGGRYQPFWSGGLAYVSAVLTGVLLAVAWVIWRASSTVGRKIEQRDVSVSTIHD